MLTDSFHLHDLRQLETDIALLEDRIKYWEQKTAGLKGIAYDAIKVQGHSEVDEKLIQELHTKMEMEENRKALIEILKHKEAYFYKILRYLTDLNYKRVLVLHYIENKSIEEISEEMNFSKRHIRRTLVLAEEKFNACVATFPYEPLKK